MEKLFNDPIKAFDFLMAGNSTVTFKSVASGKHFTYKVKRSKEYNIRFVSVFCDPNSERYSYIGLINAKGEFNLTKGSHCKDNAPSFNAFKWAWSHIRRLNIPEALEVWHEGRCGKCGRKLTDPDSIAVGLGPVCRAI